MNFLINRESIRTSPNRFLAAMPEYQSQTKPPYVSPGMPVLNLQKTTSFFEFWPSWLIYIPVVLQWLALSIRYRSLTLPLLANPKLPVSGMVGVNKSLILGQAQNELAESILPWMIYQKTNAPLVEQLNLLQKQMLAHCLSFPLVCKPDIGCRGAGVKLIHNISELKACLKVYSAGAHIMLQKLADFEPEVGIFYVRQPGMSHGNIVSMALKYMPYVIGDGKHTLGQLIKKDPRAGKLLHLYQSRHQNRWHEVVAAGEAVLLVFSASHCRGAIFKDANHLITVELTQKLNKLMRQLPEFNYGRLDVKFRDIDSLKAGRDLQIVEINAASSESLHIWDSNTGFLEAMQTLLMQYRTLFKIGAANRNKGYASPSLVELIRRWRLELKLTKCYPETD